MRQLVSTPPAFCFFLLTLGSLFAISSSPAFAADSPSSTKEQAPGNALINPGTFQGWNYGENRTDGWQATEQPAGFQGTEQAGELLSSYLLQDFTFTFRWKVSSEGALAVQFPTENPERTWQLILREGKPGIEWIALHGKTFAKLNLPQTGKPLQEHTTTIKRERGIFQITVDGEKLKPVMSPSVLAPQIQTAPVGLSLKVLKNEASFLEPRLQEPPGKSLFNGKDFSGWTQLSRQNPDGEITEWVIEDGLIKCPKDKAGGKYLRTKKLYSNFTLSFEYKIEADGNSGVGFRTPVQGWPSQDGYELQILDEPEDTPRSRSSTAAIYGNLEPFTRNDRQEAWNQMTLKVNGPMISAWVNGTLCQHANQFWFPELQYRPDEGWIGLQDHNAETYFRKIRLLEMPASEGIPQWQVSKRPETPSWRIARLLDHPLLTQGMQERLLITDRTFGPGKRPRVFTKFRGPGIISRISQWQSSAKLSFYFDGEKEPRLEGTPAELYDKLPQLSPNKTPLMTYLPYQKELRIEVAAGKKPVRMQVESIRLPGKESIASYSDEEDLIARGLLPTISYRWHQQGHGSWRDYDKAPRVKGEVASLAPGEEAELAEISDLGMVLWTRLHAKGSVLKNNDLWIKVWIDEREEPVIAAPARYIFAGLEGGNWPNYVVLSRDGLITRLAMPFANQWKIALENRGKKPLKDLAISAAYLPQTDPLVERVAFRWRLHGRFQSGKDSEFSEPFISLEGPSQCLGIVYQTPADKKPLLTRFLREGQEVSTWNEESLAALSGNPDLSVEQRGVVGGNWKGLTWRYFLYCPMRVFKSIEITAETPQAFGDRLIWYYSPAWVK
ncbi:Hypothetical protein PBC10988_15340 [Planctomycetales bacterium 10988]|nr:Hypothetical protein PBC10988_15340 [Planctomycetales bacterium 10988]